MTLASTTSGDHNFISDSFAHFTAGGVFDAGASPELEHVER